MVVSRQEGRALEDFSMACFGSRVEISASIVEGDAGSYTQKFSPAGFSDQFVREGSFNKVDRASVAVVEVEEKPRTSGTIRLLESPNSLEYLVT